MNVEHRPNDFLLILVMVAPITFSRVRRVGPLTRLFIQIRSSVWLTGDVYLSRLQSPGESSMPAKETRNQGKSMFVKEVLNDNPLANAEAVNEAWQADGMSGSISASLVSNVRSRMKLAGILQGKQRRTTKTNGTDAVGVVTDTRRVRPAMQVQSGATLTVQAKTRGSGTELMDLEVEIDRLLMKAVEIGTLPDVENALRKARRSLYASMVIRS
jgi:hypothetical protein